MAVKKTTSRKRVQRKNIERGAAHIQSTFNNTIEMSDLLPSPVPPSVPVTPDQMQSVLSYSDVPADHPVHHTQLSETKLPEVPFCKFVRFLLR